MQFRSLCEQYTHKYSTYRVAQRDHISSREHAWLKSWKAQDCTSLCPKNNCHPRVMPHSSPHLTLTTKHKFSFTHLIYFSYLSDCLTSTRKICGSRPIFTLHQSGGSTQPPSLTGYEPKSVETKVIETEAIEPEDLEHRRIELGRNLGTDPYQTHERFMRNSVTEDVDEFGKVGAETSNLQSQMDSDYDAAESIADSDLEDGELRKMLASPLYRQKSRGLQDISNTNRTGENLLQ